jgi:hypothetical protein
MSQEGGRPRVSVIIPTIGRPRYLPAAIRSALAQDYENLEIFVSDNAADPPVCLDEFKPRTKTHSIVVRRLERRKEFSEHLNSCVEAATGHYAMILSDDDLLAPGFVSVAVSCIESEPDVGVVLSQQTIIEEHFDGEANTQPIGFEVFETEKFFLEWWTGLRSPQISTFVSLFGRRSEMLAEGGFPLCRSGAHSDTCLLTALGICRKIGVLDGGLLYRVYPTSVGLSMPWEHLLEGTSVFERRIRQWVKQGRATKQFQALMLRHHTGTMIGRYRNIYRKKPGFENRIRPLFDIAGRIVVHRLFHGAKAVPLSASQLLTSTVRLVMGSSQKAVKQQ